jgi:hypothetical protein
VGIVRCPVAGSKVSAPQELEAEIIMKKAAKIIFKNIPIFTRFIINKSLAEKEFNYKKIIFLTKKYNFDPVSIWENNYKFELDKQSVKHIEGGTWLPPHRLPPNHTPANQP